MRRLIVLPLVATLALTGCGDDSSDSGPATSSGTSSAAASDDKDLSMKPTVTIPSEPAPTTLQVEDLVVGDGATAEAGKPLVMHYVGVSYSTGKQFDASWDSNKPFPFTLGAGRVIAGWDEGIVGMKVGGRRRLTIPPAKGYGAQGFPPVIAPNETLVFIVDLLEVG